MDIEPFELNSRIIDLLKKFHIHFKSTSILVQDFNIILKKNPLYSETAVFCLSLIQLIEDNYTSLRPHIKKIVFDLIQNEFNYSDPIIFLKERNYIRFLHLLQVKKKKSTAREKRSKRIHPNEEDSIKLINKSKEKIPLHFEIPRRKMVNPKRIEINTSHQLVSLLQPIDSISLEKEEKVVALIIQNQRYIYIDRLEVLTRLKNIKQIIEKLVKLRLIQIECINPL
jgi:hypothetical protein